MLGAHTLAPNGLLYSKNGQIASRESISREGLVLRTAPVWHGPLERREYSTSPEPAGRLTDSRVENP